MEDVRIPVSLEVNKAELAELKSDIEAVFDDVAKYEKSFSSKKEQFKLVDVNKTKAEIDRVIANIGRLQSEFDTVSKDTPMNRWKNVFHEISDAIRANKAELKELGKQQSLLGNSTKSLNAAQKEIARINTELSESEKRYADAKAKIDTSKRGSKGELKELERQYQQEQEILKDRLRTAKTTETAARVSVENSRNEVAAIRASREERNKQIERLRAQAQQIGSLAKDEAYVNKEEQARLQTLRNINDELRKSREYLLGLEKQAGNQFLADQKLTGKANGGTQSKHDAAIAAEQQRQYNEEIKQAKIREQVLKEEQKIRRAILEDEARRRDAIAKEEQRQLRDRIAGLNREISAVKQSAAQYYYKLRSVKMLNFALTSMTNTVKSFGKNTVAFTAKALRGYLNLIPGVTALRKAIDKTSTSQRRFNKELSTSNKHSKTYNVNLKNLLTFILKYGLGIRSIYIAWRKLRQAVSDGLESMAKQFESVNSRMSSIVSSLNYMKASVTSVVQPLLNLLAPALERISALLSDVTYKIASFIAALTGQSTVMKAIRVETDYAASLDKTAKSAKEATKELGKYDKLNVIHKDKDSGNEDFGGMGWEEVPIDSTFADWSKKFKEFLDRLFAPIKAAWEKIKGYLLNSFKFMLNELKDLWSSIAESFWRVWEEVDTQKIFENILIIAANIMQIIGVITDKLREAWEHNDNGYRTLAAIRDIILIISEKIKEASFYTIEWAKNLTFTPLFDAIADNLENRVVPAVEKVSELLKIVYEQIILKIVKDFIEKGLPQIVDLAGKVAEIIGIIAEKIRIGLQSGSNGILIVDRAGQLLQIVMDKIQECADKTKEWAEELDFRPLFSSIKTFLEDIEPLVKTVSDTLGNFYTNVLLPFWKYLIEGETGENGEQEGGIPGALKTIGEVVQSIDWEAVTNNINKLMEALEPFFELAWEVITQLVADFIAKFGEFASSEDLGEIIDKFKDWVTNADPEELASKLEKFAGVVVGITGALSLLSGVILPLMVNIMTLRNFATQGMMVKTVQSLEKEVAKLAGTGTGEGATGLAGLAGKFKGLLMNLDAVNPSLITIGTTIAGIAAIAVGGITAIASFSDMMQNGFSAASEVAMLLGIALAAVGAVLLGAPALVAGVVAAIVALVANFVIAIQTMPEELAQMFNKFGEFMGSLPQKFDEFFDGLIAKVKDFGHNLGVKIGEFIATSPQKFEEWRQNLLVFIENVDWMELGINIVKGILAIFSLPARLLAFIMEAIGEFVKSFIEGIKEGFDMHSPSKKMEPYGKMILEGLLAGITSVIKTIGTWIKDNIVQPIINGVKTYFKIVGSVANTFLDIGKAVITGLKNGLSFSAIWSNIKSIISTKANNLISNFKNFLSSSKLLTIGKNLIGGLKQGISDALGNLLGTVRDVSNSVINTFKDIFNIHSPSKVMEGIGENVMAGFNEGIDDESEEAEIATDFVGDFLSALTDMKLDAIDIVSSMVDELNDKMSNLTSLENFNISLAKIGNIKVPDIAIGNVLPSNIEFKQSDTKLDEKTINQAVRNALEDVLSQFDFNSNNPTVMLQLDKRTVAEAVWDEEEKRYKQRGATYSPILG